MISRYGPNLIKYFIKKLFYGHRRTSVHTVILQVLLHSSLFSGIHSTQCWSTWLGLQLSLCNSFCSGTPVTSLTPRFITLMVNSIIFFFSTTLCSHLIRLIMCIDKLLWFWLTLIMIVSYCQVLVANRIRFFC